LYKDTDWDELCEKLGSMHNSDNFIRWWQLRGVPSLNLPNFREDPGSPQKYQAHRACILIKSGWFRDAPHDIKNICLFCYFFSVFLHWKNVYNHHIDDVYVSFLAIKYGLNKRLNIINE
jgi:hypothetical protein